MNILYDMPVVVEWIYIYIYIYIYIQDTYITDFKFKFSTIIYRIVMTIMALFQVKLNLL